MGFAGSTILITLGLLFLFVLRNFIHNLYFHPLAKFPGPIFRRGSWAGFYLPLFLGSEVRDIKALHDKYGEVVRVGPDVLSFISAQAWKDIYGFNPGKAQLRRDQNFYLGGQKHELPQIINCNDADHSRMRKLLLHAFSDAALREQEPLMTKYFELFVQRLKEEVDGPHNGKVDILKWFNLTTFDIIGDLTFAEPFHALERGDYHFWISNIFRGVKVAPFLRFGLHFHTVGKVAGLIFGRFTALSKVRKEHLDYTATKISRRLKQRSDRKDFISYIQRFNDERGMSDSELEGTSAILILAGSETTATLLSGTIFLLLSNPDTLKMVQDEVSGAFTIADDINIASTAYLKYMHAVFEESLRLYPPVPTMLPRVTQPQGDIINGYFVPGNISVGVHQYAAYTSASNFTNPDRFDPRRWLEKPPLEYAEDHLAAKQPFSTGPRNCLGRNLAYAEMRSILARLLYSFNIELEPESKGWEKQNVFVLWDKRPLYVRLSHRN